MLLFFRVIDNVIINHGIFKFSRFHSNYKSPLRLELEFGAPGSLLGDGLI